MRTLGDREFFLHAYKGNEEAWRLTMALTYVVGLWDDLIDRDREISDDQAHRAMWAALVEIPGNVFYREYYAELGPLVRASIEAWKVSNAMQGTPGRPREIAHVARYMGAQIFVRIAAICGGHEWAVSVGPEIWLRAMRQDFAAFDREMEERNAAAPSV